MPDDKTLAEIEDDIAAEAEALDRALDDLRAELSPKALAADLAGTVQTAGADLGRTLVDTARNHPVPVALIGLGLAWLTASAARVPGHRSLDSAARRATATASDLASDWAAGWGQTAGDGAAGLLDRIRVGTEELGEAARARVVAARATALTAQARLEAAGHRAAGAVARSARDEPMLAGVVALVAGAALGAALPPSETEDRLLGAERDRLMDEAERIYREEIEKLRAGARAALDEGEAVLRDAAAAAGSDRSGSSRPN